jgi:hypothetical protein
VWPGEQERPAPLRRRRAANAYQPANLSGNGAFVTTLHTAQGGTASLVCNTFPRGVGDAIAVDSG